MPSKNSFDKILFGLTLALLVFGLIMLWSASTTEGVQNFGSSSYFVVQQLTRGVLGGLIAMYALTKLDYHKLKSLAFPLIGLSVLLLVLVKLPGIGFTANGATRWLDLGVFLFQPSEVVKLFFIIYLAAWGANKINPKEPSQSIAAPILILGLITSLILFQPDLGTALSIILTAGIMLFINGTNVKFLAILTGIGSAALGILIWFEPYRLSRITAFLNPDFDPLGIGYQINQAMIAIGSGGLFGYGYGLSRQKHFYLPETLNDSIFAVVAEELGFVRVLALLAIFIYLIVRSAQVSSKAPDQFGRMLGLGITALFGVNVIINVGAMLSLLPLTGIPLPFFSYGSSAMIVNLAAIGILLNISKQAKR
ncbi:MAG: putative lipid II flippase FtsW [Candidatus Doudnabacteria bacterium]